MINRLLIEFVTHHRVIGLDIRCAVFLLVTSNREPADGTGIQFVSLTAGHAPAFFSYLPSSQCLYVLSDVNPSQVPTMIVILRGGSVGSDTSHGRQSLILRCTRRGYCYSAPSPCRLGSCPVKGKSHSMNHHWESDTCSLARWLDRHAHS